MAVKDERPLDIAANRAARKWSRKELAGRLLWDLAHPLFAWSPRPLWGWRRVLLRLFGANIGRDVHIYPSVRIALPWNLTIGDQAAVGDRAILHSLGSITLGERVTVSQGAHLCAGTHDYRDSAMPLLKQPIAIEHDAWVCAETFYVFAAWRLWRLARKGDIVVAKTDPPLASVVVAPIARVRRARFINWVQDLFPEVAQAAGVMGAPGKLLLPLLRRLRNRALRSAEMNVVPGDRMAEHLCKRGIPRDQTPIIANWQDGALVRPVARDNNPLRRAWDLEGEFVVGYSGNLGRVHELTTVLDAMTLLQTPADMGRAAGDAGVEIRFLFIGGGALQRVLRNEIAARGLNNAVLRPYQPRKELAHSLSVADVHLVTLRPEFEGLIVPSKFYGVAAAARPTLFVGDPHGEIAQLTAAHECGLNVPRGDGAALAAAIEALAHDPVHCEALGRPARTMLETHFDKPIAIAQ